MTQDKQRTNLLTAILAGALFGVAALSGCMGISFDTSDDDAPGNEAPVAELETDTESGWTGDTFTFDASRSSDSDGSIDKWTFDFGDGNERTIEDADEADAVEHTYVDGGEYTVTVTVYDDGADKAGTLTDTASVQVAVNHREPVAASVASDGSNLTQSFATSESEFKGHDGVDRVVLDVNVESALLAGASEITVRILDDQGDTLSEETVTVGAGENASVLLDEELEPGDYSYQIEADSGAATVEGELRTHYDEGLFE